MSHAADDVLTRFRWHPQPAAAEAIAELLAEFTASSQFLARLESRLRDQCGTRLIDFVDHFAIPQRALLAPRLPELGFALQPHDGGNTEDGNVWRHAQGLFPEIHSGGNAQRRLAIAVESVADFLAAHAFDDRTEIIGPPGGQLRRACLASHESMEVWVIERHGCRAYEPPLHSAEHLVAARKHREHFRLRRRNFDNPSAGFDHAAKLFQDAAAELGVDWACDLFFSTEREFWQRRNRAGQVQRARQDTLGIGWANHDHHTYRSSREHFAELIAVLELMGFQCRERFYGGHESGWGAQVLEQSATGVVIFADVDMSPEEVSGDFAHLGLASRERLGTVGLWCQLHGEAFLQAGMHHLECRFDFDAARKQLAQAGVSTMRPFTDLPYLKQAFTDADLWPVEPGRIERLLAAGRISQQQAELFGRQGALGSHLEILQRDEGYKGFNQSGISDIIAETDPRRARVNLVSPGTG